MHTEMQIYESARPLRPAGRLKPLDVTCNTLVVTVLSAPLCVCVVWLKDTKRLHCGGKKHPLMIKLNLIRAFGSLGVNMDH